jgi:hypothetical protein
VRQSGLHTIKREGTMSYLRELADAIALIPQEAYSARVKRTFLIDAVLARAKRERTIVEDVYDAWNG